MIESIKVINGTTEDEDIFNYNSGFSSKFKAADIKNFDSHQGKCISIHVNLDFINKGASIKGIRFLCHFLTYHIQISPLVMTVLACNANTCSESTVFCFALQPFTVCDFSLYLFALIYFSLLKSQISFQDGP